MTIACSKFKLHHFYCAQPKWSVLLVCTIPGEAVGSLSLRRVFRLAVGDLVSCLVVESSAELTDSLSEWSSSFRRLDFFRHFRGVSIFSGRKCRRQNVYAVQSRSVQCPVLAIWSNPQLPQLGKDLLDQFVGVLMESSEYSRTSFVSLGLFCLTRW